MRRPAQVVAVALNVLCPYCGEPQPCAANGSDTWLPSEVEKASGQVHDCNACDGKFLLLDQQKVTVSP